MVLKIKNTAESHDDDTAASSLIICSMYISTDTTESAVEAKHIQAVIEIIQEKYPDETILLMGDLNTYQNRLAVQERVEWESPIFLLKSYLTFQLLNLNHALFCTEYRWF